MASEAKAIAHVMSGLRYPAGYRSEQSIAKVHVGDETWRLYVCTYRRHLLSRQRSLDMRQAGPVIQRQPGDFWNYGFDPDGIEAIGAVVDSVELDPAIITAVITKFLEDQGIEAQVELVWEEEEEAELEQLRQVVSKTLLWLRHGAGSTEPSDDPTPYRAALQKLAASFEDGGPTYISTCRWMVTQVFIAGKRYRGKETPNTTAWFGYLSATQRIVIMQTPEIYEVIEVAGEPDVLPAMDRIEP